MRGPGTSVNEQGISFDDIDAEAELLQAMAWNVSLQELVIEYIGDNEIDPSDPSVPLGLGGPSIVALRGTAGVWACAWHVMHQELGCKVIFDEGMHVVEFNYCRDYKSRLIIALQEEVMPHTIVQTFRLSVDYLHEEHLKAITDLLTDLLTDNHGE